MRARPHLTSLQTGFRHIGLAVREPLSFPRYVSVLVSAGCRDKMPQTAGVGTTDVLTVWRLEVEDQVSNDLLRWELSPGLADAAFSLSSGGLSSRLVSSGALLRRTRIQSDQCPTHDFISPQRPHLQIPSHWGRASTWEF